MQPTELIGRHTDDFGPDREYDPREDVEAGRCPICNDSGHECPWCNRLEDLKGGEE